MPAERYHVIFKGEIADDQEISVVKDRLVALFKVPAATVDRMFQGSSVKLKKNVDLATAQKYQIAVERTGARCRLVAVGEEHSPGDTDKARASARSATPSAPSLAKREDTGKPGLATFPENENRDFYAPPGAALSDEFFSEAAVMGDPRQVPAGNALRWLTVGFEMFKQNPLIWIALVILWFGVIAFLSLIPLLSVGVNLLIPILTGGVMLGCRDQDEGEPLQIGHLFAAFQGTGGPLALLGLLQLLSMVALAVVVGVLIAGLGAGAGLLSGISGSGDEFGPIIVVILVPLLIGMALGIPIAMGFWFAPVLVALHEVPVLESIKLSFIACLKNWLPFLVYGLILLVLFFVAIIPLGLGLLVVGPVTMASLYTSHKDIFMESLD